MCIISLMDPYPVMSCVNLSVHHHVLITADAIYGKGQTKVHVILTYTLLQQYSVSQRFYLKIW